MHILLTDLLTCPRCGPAFGLIVLADRIEDRMVSSGRLGCSNCRETYVIEAGVADLRTGAMPPLEIPDSAGDDIEDRPFRVAALLGAQPVGATLLILTSSPDIAPALAAIFPEVHLVVGSPVQAESGAGDEGIVSRVLHGEGLPFRSASFQGVAVLGIPSERLLGEVARVVAPAGRAVSDRAVPGTADSLRAAGFVIHLEDDRTVVAAASSHR